VFSTLAGRKSMISLQPSYLILSTPIRRLPEFTGKARDGPLILSLPKGMP
jgi:hypothetical protein